MSANTETQIINAVQLPKEKKPKLSAKYAKFQEFGYSLVQSLHASGSLSTEGLESSYAQLKLFDGADVQTAFYEQMFSQFKETGKVMRKFVAQRNKPPKVVKSRAKKTDDGAPKEKKERRPRAKKTTNVVADTANDLIGELVAAANEVPVETAAPSEKKVSKPRAKKTVAPVVEVAAPIVAPVVEVAAPIVAPVVEVAAPVVEVAAPVVTEKKAANKPRAKKDTTPTKESAQVEVPAAPKKASKPRAKKAEKVAVEVAPITMTDELEEEEISTQEIVINGTTYLLDDSNNLYSIESHAEIGTYNPETRAISHAA
jgi:hypothetical protein